MATIVDRDLTVRLLTEQFGTIAQLCAGFDEDTWALPTCLPGWDVKDNVSHIIGTESMLLGRANPTVDISGYEHVHNPIGEANELWVESFRDRSGAEVLESFREVTAERIAALEVMTQADFDAPSWTPAGPDETYGRFMRIRHYDCFMHTLDITGAVGVDDIAPVDHLRSALSEPISGLGFIVGKRAGMPKGTTVRLELSGPAGGTYLVEVAERASLVDHLDGEPTVSLGLDPVLFLRLTGGRRDAGPHLGVDIDLGGDIELARRLATNLTFTI